MFVMIRISKWFLSMNARLNGDSNFFRPLGEFL